MDKHKFAWSEFEQPIGWPKGRKPWMVFVAKSTSVVGPRTDFKHKHRVSDTTQSLYVTATAYRQQTALMLEDLFQEMTLSRMF